MFIVAKAAKGSSKGQSERDSPINAKKVEIAWLIDGWEIGLIDKFDWKID